MIARQWNKTAVIFVIATYTRYGLNKDSIEEDLLFPQACRIISQMAFTRPVPDHEMPLVRC